jgi:UDP-glucose 4-epimerase
MNNEYLAELIDEVKARGGGMVLHAGDKPEVVVLTVEKYNDMLSAAADKTAHDLVEKILSNGSDPASPKTVLVTGGAGYIGAHVAREFLKAGYGVVILDNLESGVKENVPDGAKFIEGDLKDANFLRDVFASEKIHAVIHMAASIEVEESVREPERYLQNNVLNTLQLLSVMNEYGVKNIVFSSTAAVYGEQEEMPIKETARLRPNNPYGFTKLMAEKMIKYYCNYLGFRSIIFR